jgi:hypothetical protein
VVTAAVARPPFQPELQEEPRRRKRDDEEGDRTSKFVGRVKGNALF